MADEAKKARPQTPGAKRGRRRFSFEDFSIVRRVLRYAHPFRARITGALVLGLLAGLLTAINLIALVPVLEILFEERSKEKLESIQDDIDSYTAEIAAETNIFSKFDPWVNKKKSQFRYTWNKWVLEEQERAIYTLAIVLVFAQILKSLLDFSSKYILQKSFYMSLVRLRTDLYDKCLHLDMPEFQRITSGDLIARMNNDMRAVRMVFSNLLSDIVLQPVTVIFLFATMMFLNWQMTLIAIIGVPIIVVPITILGKKLRNMGKKDEEEDAKILSYTQEIIQGLVIVKAFCRERSELKKFRHLSREVARRQVRREKYRLYGEPFVEITASIAMAGVLCVGAYLILKSDNASMNPAEFLAYLFILTRFYPPLKRLSSTFVKLQKSLGSAERVFDIIDIEHTIVEKPDAVDLKGFNDKIEFDNVSFSYGEGKPQALIDFTLTIPKGRKVALVGSTGAGKSTVARLLPRFFDATKGSIRIDGKEIRDVTLRSLRSLMAVVSQENILFNDTVLNNIRYAQPNASQEDVEKVAQAAYAHEFIEKLQCGYDTVIGERGGQLSGGQRQRIAIARALLANSPILILDEATSALDNESEAIVQAAIERLMENRTVLVIAHRLSTVRKADEIVVMHHGRLVEKGTYIELLEKKGRFYELLQAEELANTGQGLRGARRPEITGGPAMA